MTAVITTQNGYFIVRVPFRYDVKEAIKTIPGAKWNSGLRAWVYPESKYVAESLHEVLAWKGVSVAGDAEFNAQIKKRLEEKEAIEPVILNPGELKDIPKTTIPPFDHQKEAYWLMAKAFGDASDGSNSRPGGGYYLAHDMGTGKSCIIVKRYKE